MVQDPCSSSSPPSTIFSAVYKFLYQTSTPTIENYSISHTLAAEPLVQNDEFCLESLLTMDDNTFPDMMPVDFVKPPVFDYIDFIMGSEWSEQSSPNHSAFSSPGQYPQLVMGVPDEDVQLLPASSFEIDSPNYVSNLCIWYLKKSLWLTLLSLSYKSIPIFCGHFHLIHFHRQNIICVTTIQSIFDVILLIITYFQLFGNLTFQVVIVIHL